MGLFDRIRDVFNHQESSPPEHLEGYRRIGDQVYEAKVELADEQNPTVRLLLRVAEVFQIMGNALLRDVISPSTTSARRVADITHEQAETWYGHIPDLLIAARKEVLYAESSRVELPIQIGERVESQDMCPLSHLIGLRRAANGLEDLVADDISRMRADKDRYRQILFLYEEARTRRSTGDALVGPVMNGERVPHETHEDAKEQYWQALANYLLIVQGIENDSLITELFSPHSKLDLEDVWKVTAQLALEDIGDAEKRDQTNQELESFWDSHRITDEERRYEHTVEKLVVRGDIQENGYWYRIPFQPVYMVTASRIDIAGHKISRGHEFVWDYGKEAGQRFLSRSEFRYADERFH
ncbi:hypothetical protein [Alicyclobacillus sp. SO9]|uniref:hypothetical protein n=1 Tax=Alicyclobacillus sp. SO9 TaxID=2665646 RepID=UPI0018E7FAEE|nr:hypothetical protein [Alicyclobacillus sp. SO9]QQE78449.1 hypothetical protein GI364_21670 [Alicyclobacillus sp. SO9]